MGEMLPWREERMWGAEEELPRSMKEGFPMEVACKLRPEGEVGWGWVKVKGGGIGRALQAKDQHMQRPRDKRGLEYSGKKWGLQESRGPCVHF